MTERGEESADCVGPVLEANETSRALVAAIIKTNADVVVHDRGSYLRVLVPRACVLSRAAVEAELGRPFRLPGDLESLMPSYKGTVKMTGDEVSWSWKGPL
jgi:hypothetical protein